MAPVGSRLRTLRQNRNLTLKQVADATGLSLSFLSLVERDKVSISGDNLERLAHFYEVRMVHFFQGLEESPVLVTRREQLEERMRAAEPGTSVFVLLANRADARLEPLLIRVAPGRGDPHFRTHEGDAIVYVLEGRLRLVSETGETVELGPGDAAYYFGFPGRRLENASATKPALLLYTAAPPTNVRDDVADAAHGVLIQSEE